MSEAAAKAFEKYQAAIGEAEGAGEWFEIDQERINQFADVTIDHQFIHVDPEAAKATPFGTTIAHGFLTLSMLTHLSGSIPQDTSRFAGVVMGINYGFDKVRFVSPVKVGSRIRATSVLANAELKGTDTIQSTRTFTVEIEGEDRPALVADWITRTIYG
jgi:acyl dehydratase